jgi:serine/threonine protein kinase
MNSPENSSPAVGCDLKRIHEFLNSDQYHIGDSDLTTHLDVCPSCRAFLEAQAGGPDRWHEASQLLQTHEYDRASSVDFSAATYCSEQSPQPIVIKDVLDSLVPSEHPNHMGRLGTYEVTGVIGVGGMGVVLKAIDPSLDRVVAVKVMSPKLAHNENARKRFAREAKAAAAVLHPNVIPIHSVSSGSTLPYLVMSYIRGGSLQKRLDQSGPLLLVEVLRIGSQIAAGLAAAHEQGLIHRDIKPENILLEEGVERVTITDFGLARSVDDNSITQLGSIAGTPQYMSPEQARGAQLDQQSDLFSLGSLLYALCTGRPPFRDDTSYGVMRKIIDEEPEPIRKYSPETPLWMVELVEQLMAKKKENRFESAREVHTLLDACISHIQQPSSNPIPEQLLLNQSSTARKKMMKLFAGIGLVMIAIALGMTQWRFHYLNNKSLEEHYTLQDLDALDGYVESLMNSPYDPVFLNIGRIGKDENYLSILPSEGGVTVRFPAYDMENFANKRQAKYAKRLTSVASALSVSASEKSEVSNDGSVKGINYEFRINGDTKAVPNIIKKLIVDTFLLDGLKVCGFRYSNMPGHYSHRDGEEPKKVTNKEFMVLLESGTHVYMGEQNQSIYLIPRERISERPVTLDSEIYYAESQGFRSEEIQRIRSSQ